ncbi:MAG: hypothetical protein M3Q75_08445 [Gemmatimonadota bacterium]|nr:hypothetical protein [Gemmatimonadota bacterium]
MEKSELKRRVAAARILHGETQAEMNERGRIYGIGSTILGQVERGSKKADEEHLVALERFYAMPARWFREPDLQKILFPPTAPQNGVDPKEFRNALAVLERALGAGGQAGQTGSSDSH